MRFDMMKEQDVIIRERLRIINLQLGKVKVDVAVTKVQVAMMRTSGSITKGTTYQNEALCLNVEGKC